MIFAVRRTSNFIHCCFAKEKRPDLVCVATKNAFSNCEDILRDVAVRYVIWLILLFTLAGNSVVLVTRFFMKDKNVAQKVLIMNLGVSDLMMGVYLTIIASKDQLWRGRYFSHDEEWRSSVGCRAAGVLSMMSSQASLLTLVFITYDRFRSITNGIKFRRLGLRSVSIILTLIWSTSLALSVSPAVIKSYFFEENETGFYGTNTVCLPLQLPGQKAPGWEYCLGLFGVVNLIMSVYMAVAYAWMLMSIHRTGQVAKSDRLKREKTLAKRMLFIVVTDLLCWFPVIAVIFLSLLGLLDNPDRSVFAWLAVCIIPINSAVNPILYTISTPSVLTRITKLVNRDSSKFSEEPTSRSTYNGYGKNTKEEH